MAKIEGNLIIHGLSGMLGKQVVVRRMKNGQYVLAAKPVHRSREATDAQRLQREKFRRAVLYAKGAKGRAEYREAAELRCVSAFNVAVADFLHPPVIRKIDISGYKGAIGETIRITADDDVKVKSVGVMIVNDDGTPVEKGTAIPGTENSSEWLYSTKCAVGLSSVKIVVDVVNLAGRVTEVAEHT